MSKGLNQAIFFTMKGLKAFKNSDFQDALVQFHAAKDSHKYDSHQPNFKYRIFISDFRIAKTIVSLENKKENITFLDYKGISALKLLSNLTSPFNKLQDEYLDYTDKMKNIIYDNLTETALMMKSRINKDRYYKIYWNHGSFLCCLKEDERAFYYYLECALLIQKYKNHTFTKFLNPLAFLAGSLNKWDEMKDFLEIDLITELREIYTRALKNLSSS